MAYNRGGDGKPKGFGFSSFSVAPRRTGPETQLAQMGYGVSGITGRSYVGSNLGKRRIKSEEDYFDDDGDEAAGDEDCGYQPAPGSPGQQTSSESDSDDPLDAFMAGIEKEVKKQVDKKDEKKKKKNIRDDIEEEDVEEAYYRYMEENPNAGVINDDEDDPINYDADGNPILPDRKIIDPLPPIDHDDFDYEKFTKNFYVEHDEIKELRMDQVEALRTKLGIRVSGLSAPKPVSSFAHFGFDEPLIKSIRKQNYTSPMPIQAQGIPISLSGRDIIGIAKTGSGKTAAFIWPLLVHIMDQRELKQGEGPIGLICAPTRELSQQIYHEAKKFGKVYNIKVVCAYGGGSMWEQCQACEEGAEIIVATPGRLIDLVKKKATNLARCTFLVFDEADRMFDLGFEPQVRSIANHVRPNRQTLLFSATFRKKVERLARDILTDPIRVVQGDVGEANEDVQQIVKVFPIGAGKWQWLTTNLVQMTTVGSVLIFVTRKANSDELANNLKLKDFTVGLMHGDMSQSERNEVINKFKKREMPILVATDVAARGLDIPHIRNVINYDVARDIDTHTHRVGRTGRAGTRGTAYTLLTTKDKEFCPLLVRNLEGANQVVPQELLDIANQCSWFKNSRYKHTTAKRLNVGGKGLGFRERPGLGNNSAGGSSSAPSSSSSSTAAASFSAYEPSARTGPQSDRVAALRSAFSAQFKSNFVASEEEAKKPQEYTNPRIDGKTKKRSRWE